MHVVRRAVVMAAAWSLWWITLPAGAEKPYEPEVGQKGKDVVWVPTPDEVVDKMLDMAQVTAKDYVIDLGSGDGKIAIAAAKRGARAKGIEYNPKMVALSRHNAQVAGVPQVQFVRGDIFQVDFSQADVLTLYLLPELNERLMPKILAMKPGTRVVSHQFAMGDWPPDESVSVGSHRALFWRVPAKVAGRWTVQFADEGGPRTVQLKLRQTYQRVEGESVWDGATHELSDVALSGAQLRFTAKDASGAAHRFEASAETRGRLRGTVTLNGGGARSFQARRS